MFIQKLVWGSLGLWLKGELPENLRQIQQQKYGWFHDPLFASILGLVAIVSGVILVGFFIAVIFSRYPALRLALAAIACFLVGVCILGLGAMAMQWNVHIASNLIAAKSYLGLSSQDLAALSREGLRHHAEENLKNSGQNLRAAELRLHSYHPEREKLRKDFEERYATFRTLGMIEDVGYGPFIPVTLR